MGKVIKGVKGNREGFSFEVGKEEHFIFILHERSFSAFISKDPFVPSDEIESPFVLLLRKHLVGSTLVSIYQNEFDRVIILDFEVVYPGRLVERKRLFVEFIPKKLNAILVGEGRRVIGSWNKVSYEANFYLSPPSVGVNPLHLNEFNENAFKTRSYQGLSRNLISFLNSFPNVEIGWNEWLDRLQKGNYKPTLFLSPEGHPLDYWIFDYDMEGAIGRKYFNSLSELIESFLKEKAEVDLLREEEQRRAKEIEDRRRYLLKKRENLNKFLSRRDEVRRFEIIGEMIFANLSSIPDKASRVNMVNPYTGEIEEVELDPSLTPAMNAQRYFKEASKLKRGIEKAEEELKKVEEELSKLEGVKTLSLSVERKKPSEVSSPFREFKYNGWTILVGKGSSSNEILTFKIASGEDVWLHVKGSPGSHVIIKNFSRSDVPQDVLEIAASLAAYYSKAKMNTKVPVDYTLVKYVKRHPSGKKGAVLIKNQKTIWVRPRSGENL
ncbi:MAG: NFACT family protein [Synergistetes bacterium]|nr:NFACT family protein [Synergistota bacterium]